MQTFLPYADFDQSARVLDNKRLGKQRVETLQVMTCLVGGLTAAGRTYAGWVNHPAVKMWRGYESELYAYQVAIVHEWERRGYKDTCLGKTFQQHMAAGYPGTGRRPPWLGDYKLHESHRSNLVRKDPDFYGPLWPMTPLGLDYVWPV